MVATPAKRTRRYDSPVRRERFAETRARIVEAGAALVHELGAWDWRAVSVREIAARAGVHERTIHRHFAAERDLRAAVLQHLIDEAGVSVEGLRLADVPPYGRQLFEYLSTFAGPRPRNWDTILLALDQRRRAALFDAVAEAAPDLPADERRLAAAMVDVLWSWSTYKRLTTDWGLTATEAADGATWLVALLSEALKAGRGPASANHDR